MRLRAVLFFSSLCSVFAENELNRNRDGLIESVPGYSITYYSARWEPLCGTITAAPSAPLDRTTQCIPAIERYTNDTTSTLSFYDSAGVKLTGIGVGMGVELCMCFSMASTSVSYDICWAFDSIGQYYSLYDSVPDGSYRPGGAKALPQCGNVNVTALEAQWTRTAVMPTATGPVETFNLPTTATVIQTLTPTLVNLTISSSTVVTDADGHLTTEDFSYTTTAAVINFQPADEGLSLSNRIALGIGLGIGLPALLVALMAWRWQVLNAARVRRRP